jgi:hypothetical protein
LIPGVASEFYAESLFFTSSTFPSCLNFFLPTVAPQPTHIPRRSRPDIGNGEYGCCPYSSGVCCPDHSHCCPNGYSCDSQQGECVKRMNAFPGLGLKERVRHSLKRRHFLIKSILICPICRLLFFSCSGLWPVFLPACISPLIIVSLVILSYLKRLSHCD